MWGSVFSFLLSFLHLAPFFPTSPLSPTPPLCLAVLARDSMNQVYYLWIQKYISFNPSITCIFFFPQQHEEALGSIPFPIHCFVSSDSFSLLLKELFFSQHIPKWQGTENSWAHGNVQILFTDFMLRKLCLPVTCKLNYTMFTVPVNWPNFRQSSHSKLFPLKSGKLFLKFFFSSIAWEVEINTEELFVNVSLSDLLSKKKKNHNQTTNNKNKKNKNPDDSLLKPVTCQLSSKRKKTKQKRSLSSSSCQSPQRLPAAKEPHHAPVSDILIYAECTQ